MQQLPPDQFVRVHRSYCVSVAKITKTSRQDITVGGQTIPIGTSYEDAAATIRVRLIS